MKLLFGLKMSLYALAFVIAVFLLLSWLLPAVKAMMLFGIGADLRIVGGDFTGYDPANDLIKLQIEVGRTIPQGLQGIQITFVSPSGERKSFELRNIMFVGSTKVFRFDTKICDMEIARAYVSPLFEDGAGEGSRQVELKTMNLAQDAQEQFYESACSSCDAGGEGTAKDPIEICSCFDIQAVKEDPSKHYTLGKSITCEDFYFEPIMDFTGTFDGQDHTLWGLSIVGQNNVGLFGSTQGATIKNINIANSDFTGQLFVGSLIGKQESGTVTNAHSDAIVEGVADTGGLIGYSLGDVTASSSSGEVKSSIVGGQLVGTCECMIKDSTSTVTVNAPVQGFIGKIISGGVGK